MHFLSCDNILFKIQLQQISTRYLRPKHKTNYITIIFILFSVEYSEIKGKPTIIFHLQANSV